MNENSWYHVFILFLSAYCPDPTNETAVSDAGSEQWEATTQTKALISELMKTLNIEDADLTTTPSTTSSTTKSSTTASTTTKLSTTTTDEDTDLTKQEIDFLKSLGLSADQLDSFNEDELAEFVNSKNEQGCGKFQRCFH